jgi:hypothetical protein
MNHDRIDRTPFTIFDEHPVAGAMKGPRPVGVTMIESFGGDAHDVVTLLAPADAQPAAQTLKIALLREARDAALDRVAVLAGTETDTIYHALGLRPVGAVS